MHSLTSAGDTMTGTESAASNAVPACSCDEDPIACLETMFVEMVQRGRINRGQCPARRPVFVQTHGVAHGRLEIEEKLPEAFRVGIFAQQPSYPVWVRFSTDPFGTPDFKSTVGIGIKLFGVDGEKVLSPDETAATADFLFQNMDVFFVDTATDMCAFTKAALSGEADAYLAAHPVTQEILNAMEKVVPTALGTDLWSVIPLHLGSDRYCKYKLEPVAVPDAPAPNYQDPDYLQADLAARLAAQEYRFRFMIQPQTDPEAMPLDRATVRWSEETSPPLHVATLVLPQQDLTTRGQAEYGEALSFNPWRTLAEHAPVGSLAEARQVVYRASARLRRDVNGQPIGEPVEPRPATSYPPARDTQIVRAAIYPGIGIARIGDSHAEDGYYIGPEVTDPVPTQPGQNRDAQGAIKRQAARFRVYGYNAAGEVIGEIGSAANAKAGIVAGKVTWTAHLANRKAQWYQFQAAFDIPQAVGLSVTQRNPTVTDRAPLAIDPGPRTIQGARLSGLPYQFDTGTFQGTTVPLGELRTDEQGRLLVLGGTGKSASPTGQPVFRPSDSNSFNNADGWYDDISDGPVTASVSIDGRDIPVEPSWVVVAPPNYGPDVIGWRTMYDLLVDQYVECGWLSMPETVSFTADILPLLRRLTNLQWVNKGFAGMFGKQCPMDFDDPDFIAKLAHCPATPTSPDPYAELRQLLYNLFRPQSNQQNDPSSWPWIYGDAWGTFDTSADYYPNYSLELSQVRATMLERWVKAEFVNDWTPDTTPPQTLDQVPLTDQPAMLDRAALHFCLADAFHPGCEMTWPMRHTTMYSAPFRIRQRDANVPEPDYGPSLDQATALQPGGPLYAQGPGDISRWMALPWQGDTAYCRSGYDPDYDPYLPTFWAGRVPNQVLTEEDYQTVMDDTLPRDARIAAFQRREKWIRALKGTVAEQMMQMIASFGELGIVEARPGPSDDPDFPATIFVEGLPPGTVATTLEPQRFTLRAQAVSEGRAEEEAPTQARTRLAAAGWDSVEQLNEARELRRIRRA